MLSRLGFDVLAAVILAVTAAIGAYMPRYLAQRDRSLGGNGRPFTLVVGNMFSAGVMVSAGFCHLLGEAVKQMPAMRFSLATFLCGLGYLITLVADTAATLLTGAGHTAEGVEVAVAIDLAEKSTPRWSGNGIHSNFELKSSASIERRATGQHTFVKQSEADEEEHALLLHGNSSDPTNTGLPGRSQSAAGKYGVVGGGLQTPASFELDRTLHRSGSAPLGCHQNCGGRQQRGSGHGRATSVSFLTAVLMGVALCFHSLLEGAAMGAQPTISNSLHIFIAIVSHKGLAAYALGSSIVESRAEMDRFLSVVIPFTFASPVGIFLGYILSGLAQGIGAAAISALASGTFLYVAFMEVIPREIADPHGTPAKLGALMLGYAAMSVLAIWA